MTRYHEPNPQFSITAKTCTLKYNSQENGGIILDGESRYEIPIYQRPYSWSEPEIRRFLQDILSSFQGSNREGNEPMFIGTMQLTEGKDDNRRQIIDGQQRLTTFLVLFQVLRKMFKGQTELDNFENGWLLTRVNNGEQQLLLDQFLCNVSFDGQSLNPYIRNATLICDILNEEMRDEATGEPVTLDVPAFVRHLLTNIYFVVIETKAGLTKTLQIFNAINTSGLDLNGGDIFKIRMFEYLRDVKVMNETVFEKISELYQKIDRANVAAKYAVTSIHEILGIYQFLLIARHNLTSTLYTYAPDTFFDRLFDSILNHGQWDHFGEAHKVDLSLADIDQLIDIRVEWENSWYGTAEDACLYHLSEWSRYSRYWVLCILFRYVYRDRADAVSRSLLFYRQLTKLFIIYSCRFLKGVNEIHSFNYSILQLMLQAVPDKVIDAVNKKIGRLENHKEGGDFLLVLNGEIAHNAKIKNLLCRLSAMLDEDYLTTEPARVEELRERLFFSRCDIEHIQSYHDMEEQERDRIWSEWKGDINGIGNLTILEETINRSIGNYRYVDKIPRYNGSKFLSIQNLVSGYATWNYEHCLKRKNSEVMKITTYLFNPMEGG